MECGYDQELVSVTAPDQSKVESDRISKKCLFEEGDFSLQKPQKKTEWSLGG